MKKLLLFIAGISILFFAGCSNGNQSHGNEGMGDTLPADPPLGYVIELKPLGNFSRQKAEQLREELVKQLGGVFSIRYQRLAWMLLYLLETRKKYQPHVSTNQETGIGLGES